MLNVDLRVPPDWGGTHHPENLQPLCEECCEGKRQYLHTHVPTQSKSVKRLVSTNHSDGSANR
jgi:hypothetical protein